MPVGAATLAAVITLDDQASAKLLNVNRNVVTTGEAFRRALPGLATFGSSLASLLITTGALNSESGRYVTIALSMSSAIASTLPALDALNKALRTNATIQAFLTTLSRPHVAIPLLAGAAVAGVGTAAFLANRGGGPTVINDFRGATFSSEEDRNQTVRRIEHGIRR